MPYPTIDEYSSAISDFKNTINDPEIINLNPQQECGEIFKIVSHSLNSMIFKFRSGKNSQTGRKEIALKVFLKDRSELEERYENNRRAMDPLDWPGFIVDFDYAKNGILVGGETYPFVKMDWIDGLTLDAFLDQLLNDANEPLCKDVLGKIAEGWFSLVCSMKQKNITHGDLHVLNIMIKNLGKDKYEKDKYGVYLVDYDGLNVGGANASYGRELGDPNFQHPKRRSFNEDLKPTRSIDNFSTLVIYAALKALSVSNDPGKLWNDFNYIKKNCGNYLLFKKEDFECPRDSPVFKTLLQDKNNELYKITGGLLVSCVGDNVDAPFLDEIRYGFARSVPGDQEKIIKDVLGFDPRQFVEKKIITAPVEFDGGSGADRTVPPGENGLMPISHRKIITLVPPRVPFSLETMVQKRGVLIVSALFFSLCFIVSTAYFISIYLGLPKNSLASKGFGDLAERAEENKSVLGGHEKKELAGMERPGLVPEKLSKHNDIAKNNSKNGLDKNGGVGNGEKIGAIKNGNLNDGIGNKDDKKRIDKKVIEKEDEKNMGKRRLAKFNEKRMEIIGDVGDPDESKFIKLAEIISEDGFEKNDIVVPKNQMVDNCVLVKINKKWLMLACGGSLEGQKWVCIKGDRFVRLFQVHNVKFKGMRQVIFGVTEENLALPQGRSLTDAQRYSSPYALRICEDGPGGPPFGLGPVAVYTPGFDGKGFRVLMIGDQ